MVSKVAPNLVRKDSADLLDLVEVVVMILLKGSFLLMRVLWGLAFDRRLYEV